MKLAGPVVLSSACHQLHALRLELALELAHVGERRQLLGVAVPAGVEGQDVLVEHALEQSDT